MMIGARMLTEVSKLSPMRRKVAISMIAQVLGCDAQVLQGGLEVLGVDQSGGRVVGQDDKRSSDCSLALAATVSDLAGTRSDWVQTEDLARLQEQAHDTFAKRCP